jgi:hypothetical protein
LGFQEHAIAGFIGFSCQEVISTFEPFNVFSTLTQMKGRHRAQAILAEYEQAIEFWKFSI